MPGEFPMSGGGEGAMGGGGGGSIGPNSMGGGGPVMNGDGLVDGEQKRFFLALIVLVWRWCAYEYIFILLVLFDAASLS